MLERLKNMIPRKGEWVPLIPFPIRWFILSLWALEPLARGVDYMTGNDDVTQSLSRVEAAFPLPIWGMFCLVSGAMILAGFAGRWRRMSIIGLYFAGATYLALAVGLAGAVWDRGGDGFRSPFMFAVFGLTYWAAAVGYAMSAPRSPLIVVDDDDDVAPDVKADRDGVHPSPLD